jgi:DNA repair exonuclease SbcCD nuclease subunit
MKFLHIADIHLGCTRYQLEESPADFFRAWYDALQKYAVGNEVDFVLICGDFFHKRNVEPQAMNHAMAGLELLKKHNIPVLVIEGNHDQTAAGNSFSWLRSLSAWGLLTLLEPHIKDGIVEYKKWDEAEKSGSFIDIGNARIFGSKWYGASANVAIPMLTAGIKENRREGAFHILMLHTDVEGHQTHPIPSLTIANLKELKSVTDYVGLGHTHMKFEIDNWCFNPGSLEITNISEYDEVRGAFLVTVADDLSLTYEHLRDYRQRPFRRITFSVTADTATNDVTDGVIAKTISEFETHPVAPSAPEPIVEITIRGHLGFPTSLLETQKIRDEVQKISGALHVRFKNATVPVEYAVAADADEEITRDMLERRVVEDLIARDVRYKDTAESVADAIIGAKRMALSDEDPERIAEFIAMKIGH